MKLLTKLTLTSTLSKIATVILFIILLPVLIDRVAFQSTNRLLKQQAKKVMTNIQTNGIDYYLQGDSTYGSYTLLREEYISLERARHIYSPDTIQTAQRIIEGDTVMYRILNQAFEYNDQVYELEIGKTIASISQYNSPLQRIALYVLGMLTILTLLTDISFTRILLKPLQTIIQTKLINPVFPFKEIPPAIRTTTRDFRYLDNSLIALMNRIKEDFDREREFTSNASHELMTPIGILQTKMENVLLSNDLDETAMGKIMEMMKTLNRLKKIVHSLLLISRIENDQYARQDNIQPEKMIGEIIQELTHRLEDKNIRMAVSLQQHITLRKLNHDLLFQLFYNLINNAIRYNKPDGSIHISDTLAADGSYTIAIRDTGIGIDPSDIDTIFNRFRKKNTIDGEGYGLGLSIVKSIADYHGIRVKVVSEVGTGTTINVVFPSVG
ncbi:cell wall metabolism sensor histidine kinase WalK [Chitinophaga sp. CF418]|uniref:sensor histidine kinase n=1 Tax=Chitinophaga sp. CF418 TaxID=1855287 RepID=UPI0009162C83|nr:HAMP domain-containing sensor histidine kinase [Chitinophaga sp. CF418]SHM86438.1 Signal transduction histidine kinase [Chitinophaga sp. CF418]